MEIVCRLSKDQATTLKGVFDSRGCYPLPVAHRRQFAQNPYHLGGACPLCLIIVFTLNAFIEFRGQRLPQWIQDLSRFLPRRSRPAESEPPLSLGADLIQPFKGQPREVR
jgi:hypothetical protein